MAKSLVLNTGNIATIAASATVYGFISNGSETHDTEADRDYPIREALTVSRLNVRIRSNDRGASSVTFRKNGADQSLAVSIGASTTGYFEDVSNSVSLTAGDKINYKLVTGAGGTSYFIMGVGVMFEASGGKTIMVYTSSEMSTASASSTNRCTINPGTSIVSSETNTPFIMRMIGTARNLFICVMANARTTTTTYRVRKNSANGNGVVSVTSTATGEFEDTTNTDDFTATDTLNLQRQTGTGTGTITHWHALHIEGQSNKSRTTTTNTTIGASVAYSAIGGNNTRSTESDYQFQSQFGGILSYGYVRVSSNSRDGTGTIRSRLGGANGNIVLSITASTTGVFEDTSNTDTIADSTVLAVSSIYGGTTGTTTLGLIGFLVTDTDTLLTAEAERDAEVTGSVTTNSARAAELEGVAAVVLTATQDGANIALEWTY